MCAWRPFGAWPYEAADTGMLSPELAAGIRRVKGAKRLGTRVGNWLTLEQARKLLQALAVESVRGKRDRAIIALLLGCGLRRAELVGLKTRNFQLREEHWVVTDLIGKGSIFEQFRCRYGPSGWWMNGPFRHASPTLRSSVV